MEFLKQTRFSSFPFSLSPTLTHCIVPERPVRVPEMAGGGRGGSPGQRDRQCALERAHVGRWQHRNIEPLPGHQTATHRTDNGRKVRARINVLVDEQLHAAGAGLHGTGTVDAGQFTGHSHGGARKVRHDHR